MLPNGHHPPWNSRHSSWKETCGDLVASCGFGQRAELDLVAELGDLGATGEKVSCSAGRPEAGGELF
jgi:hypothetical protein